MAINENTKAAAEQETELVGYVGSIWFALIALLIFLSFILGRIRSSMAKKFVFYSFIACILEIPRFVEG